MSHLNPPADPDAAPPVTREENPRFIIIDDPIPPGGADLTQTQLGKLEDFVSRILHGRCLHWGRPDEEQP